MYLLLKKIRAKEEKDKCRELQKAFTKLTDDGNTPFHRLFYQLFRKQPRQTCYLLMEPDELLGCEASTL